MTRRWPSTTPSCSRILAGRAAWRGPRDLMIAATARATGRVLVTTDTKAGFGELPEVAVREITH